MVVYYEQLVFFNRLLTSPKQSSLMLNYYRRNIISVFIFYTSFIRKRLKGLNELRYVTCCTVMPLRWPTMCSSLRADSFGPYLPGSSRLTGGKTSSLSMLTGFTPAIVWRANSSSRNQAYLSSTNYKTFIKTLCI